MSDESIIEKIDISQSGRWYRWNTKELPISRSEITVSSANTHIIPANDLVAYRLQDVIKGNIVKLKGYLVYIGEKDNFKWNSSLTRSDTGNGACEVFYVEELEILNPYI